MSQLLKKEDYWAIYIGFFLLFIGTLLFFSNPPKDLESEYQKYESTMQSEMEKAGFETREWWIAYDKQQKIKGSKEPVGKFLKWISDKPASWTDNPVKAFLKSEGAAQIQTRETEGLYQTRLLESKRAESQVRELQANAAAANFQNDSLNQVAITSINHWREFLKPVEYYRPKYHAKPYNKFSGLVALFIFLMLLFGFAHKMMGGDMSKFINGFLFVFAIGIISYLLAAQGNMKEIGFGYAAWAILIGLLISNTIGTPKFVNPALLTSFYIKTGLVLLGAEILFGKILAIGLPGIFVAWVVTPIVLITTYWFGQKILKIPSKTLNMTISADMSVCGVSAAVATAAACKASKEELTLAIGMSMIFTSVMMIALPAFINFMGMPEILGGAWIGGTIDATGAVVAAGAFLGDDALNVAATIKMIQNILIGIIAFGVAVYFATKVENGGKANVGANEIWKRFPKFILGFIGASVIFSLLYEFVSDAQAYALIDQGVIRGFSKNMRGWLFCLAFVSIGLSTNFKELRGHLKGGKPLLLYLCGQILNLGLTLLMAYIMFYKVFPEITAGL